MQPRIKPGFIAKAVDIELAKKNAPAALLPVGIQSETQVYRGVDERALRLEEPDARGQCCPFELERDFSSSQRSLSRHCQARVECGG